MTGSMWRGAMHLAAAISVSLCAVSALAAGTTSFVSREFDLWPSAAATGGVVSTSRDPLVALWGNPAGLANRPGQVGATHSEWIADTRIEQLGVALGGGSAWRFGVSTHLVSTDDIPFRPLSGGVAVPYASPLGTFEVRDFNLGLTGAYRVRPGIDLGLTARYLAQKIHTVDASTIAFDAGMMWQARPNLRAGLVVASLGPSLDWGSVKAPLPRAFRGGLMWSPHRTLNLSGDLWLQKDRPARGNLGVEWLPVSMLALRTGSLIGAGEQNITAGLGIMWRGIELDYAVIPMSNDLGTAHRLAIRLIPSGLRSKNAR